MPTAPTQTDPADRNAQRAELAAEIAELTGCSPKIAGIAAGAYVNMNSAPGYGLRDGTPEGSQAAYVLNLWLAEQAVAPLSRSSSAAGRRVLAKVG